MPDGIDAATLDTLISAGSGVTVLDVRSEEEVRNDPVDPGRGTMVQLHIDAIRDDPDRAVQAIKDIDGPEPVVVICWKGACSQDVAAILEDHGLDTYYLEDGADAL